MKVELNARNIVNLEVMDSYINAGQFHPESEKPQIQNWRKKQLKSYLLNEYPHVDKVSTYKKSDPDWLKKAVEEEKALSLTFNIPFFRKIDHVIDYFESLDESELDKIYKIPVDVAIKKSEEWTKQLQKNAPKDIDAAGEAVVRKYAGGVTWKQLLTKEALQREGSKPRMDHCVGGKVFLEKLEKMKAEFYSLRDSSDHPQCTIEVERNAIEQMKGFNDGPVKKEFIQYCKDFIENPIGRKKYSRVNDLDLIGMIEVDGKWLDIYALPKNLTIKESLDLRDIKITSLPDNLTIEGSLNLINTEITVLPENLTVQDSLYLRQTKITSLPKNLTVGDLFIDDIEITFLSENITIGGSLRLKSANLTISADNLTIGGALDLSNSGITSLPKNLTVGALYLDDTKITMLPKNLTVGKNLHLGNTKITMLPKNLTVKDLYIEGTKITTLPDNLTVKGSLNLCDTEITMLPKTLKVANFIYIDKTFPKEKYPTFNFKVLN